MQLPKVNTIRIGPEPKPRRENHGLGRVVGFALLVEQEDGSRMIVHSNTVMHATITVNTNVQVIDEEKSTKVESQVRDTEIKILAESFSITQETHRLDEILEDNQRLIESKGDQDVATDTR